jgi:dolichol kinase
MSRLSTSQHLIQSHLPVSAPGISNPPLPEWLLKLPGVPRVVDRLGVTEFRRRLFHMSPALIPVGLPLIPHQDVWGPPLVSAVCILSFVGFLLAIALAPFLTRNGEASWMRAVLGYMVPILGGLVMFPGRAELGLMTLQIIALGDGSATLGGLMLGGQRLPWNRRKTFSGLLCFTVVGTLAATYSYWGEARPGIPILTAGLICGAAALCAAIVESLPIRSNDNLRVGLTALIVGVTMSTLVL